MMWKMFNINSIKSMVTPVSIRRVATSPSGPGRLGWIKWNGLPQNQLPELEDVEQRIRESDSGKKVYLENVEIWHMSVLKFFLAASRRMDP